ncbi:MAG: 2-hydroxyacid dehydrogenase [Parvibaculum sp.]|uniref:2-hydroxyacid dehydrogenase n=1 Tax=Parvibaculum sp. TaxID=2024848 RepID=UPI0034A08ED4
MSLKLALLGQTCADNRAHMEARLNSKWETGLWLPGEPLDKGEALMRDADAVVVGSDALVSGGAFGLIPKARKLSLFQLPFAGFDWLKPEGLPQGCYICNAQGHEQAMAEFSIASLLEWEIGFRKLDASFRGGSWKYQGTSRDPEALHGEVHGKTLGIFGYGNIGREAATRAAAFGMHVVAIARSPRDKTPAPLDWIGTRADMGRFLAESDYILLACDLNDETRHAIDAASFAGMKRSAFIINVARGPVIQEEALYKALTEKRIAGAAIDTWYIYPGRPLPGGTPEENPRPSRFPFHELDNLIMTPHCSAHTEGSDIRRWQSIAVNLDAFAEGREPPGTIMRGAGRPNAA